jgi:hypothetical protein
MKPKKQFSEKALESLEIRIPQMAQAAFSQAHLKALAVSGKVLQVPLTARDALAPSPAMSGLRHLAIQQIVTAKARSSRGSRPHPGH